jgi:hypothetical protein
MAITAVVDTPCCHCCSNVQTPESSQHVFCSELSALYYQELGLLTKVRAPPVHGMLVCDRRSCAAQRSGE